VFVESPITVDRSLGRDEAIEIATQAYAEVLARYALKYPGQWLGWFKA
jgi:predicted LPLAT superfamily acyltransferase